LPTNISKNKKMRSSLLLIFPLWCFAVLTGFGQKGTFPELTQLQGPQKPRAGFIVQASTKGPADVRQSKQITSRLAAVIDGAYRALRRGGSSAAAVKSAARSIAALRMVGAFGIVALDAKGTLAAFSSDGVGNFAGPMCGSTSIGDTNAATETCADVQRHAVPVSDALKTFIARSKGGSHPNLTVLDAFGNMAFSESTDGLYVGYLAADGRAVIR
jgi:isoaspartyl peptidase/L-asparaginase-like protein (Ntn-hydrolase superfamily)